MTGNRYFLNQSSHCVWVTSSPLLQNDVRFKTIYLILQDLHVHQQRKFYEEHKKHLDTVFTLSGSLLKIKDQLLLLVLMRRFEEEKMEAWHRNWYKAIEGYAKEYFPICTFCGIYSVGDMCGREEWNEPIYLRFEYNPLV